MAQAITQIRFVVGNYSFTVGEGSDYKFASKMASDSGYAAESVTGLDLPEIRTDDFDMPNQDGAFRPSTWYAGRKIGVPIMILPSLGTMAAYLADRNTLFSAMNAKKKGTLYIQVNGVDTYQIDCYPERVDLPANADSSPYMLGLIQFFAENPLLLSQSLQVQETAVTSGGGGARIAAHVPIAIAGPANTNPNFTNPGNADADVLWRITGPGTNFVVQNLTTGKSFQLNMTLAGGLYVEIDTKAQTILQGGFTNQSGAFAGDLMQLAPGTNLLTFTAQSGTTADTRLKGTWRGSSNGF